MVQKFGLMVQEDAAKLENIPIIIVMLSNEMQERVERAVSLFKSGYNCSQSVVAAFADLYGVEEQQALRMSASFGGGIGRMRQTCGAACGMFMLAGLDCGTTDPKDREGKSHNYAVVQELARQFKETTGSLICGELLGLTKPEGSPQAEARTPEYYQKRPCSFMVETAAKLFAEYVENQKH